MRYRVVVACRGLTGDEATNGLADVLAEFAERPWHEAVTCEWDAGVLRLTADNDFDATGHALLDEFGDVVVASIDSRGDLQFDVESVRQL